MKIFTIFIIISYSYIAIKEPGCRNGYRACLLNQASASSSPARCIYLTGYNLIPSEQGNGKPPL